MESVFLIIQLKTGGASWNTKRLIAKKFRLGRNIRPDGTRGILTNLKILFGSPKDQDVAGVEQRLNCKQVVHW